MKIRFAKNIDAISGGMEIGPDELGGKMGLERVRQLSQDGIAIATDIFKNHQDIKQVTLDTMTDEERELIAKAVNSGKGIS